MRLLLILCLLAAALPVYAVPIFGLRTDNHLVSFDSATPGTVADIGLITGIGGGETLVGIDFRPLDGVLYAFTVDAASNAVMRTYTLNTATAAATLVGATASGVAGLSSTAFHGVSFNPTVDRVRVVNSLDENIRINPANGSLAGNDVDLTPGTVGVSAVAYDRPFTGTTATTLFGIDTFNDNLVRIGGIDGNPSPNLGAVTNVGALGVDAGGFCGMDVDPATGTCFAAMAVAGSSGLYNILLSTGAATFIGTIGTGSLHFQAIAVRLTANAAPIITLPATQSTPVDTNLVLTGATAISVSDADSGSNAIELQVVVSAGTISLASTGGLSFALGNGTDDILLVCTGTATDLNAALAAVTFKPAAGFNGNATISISLSDGGASGFGGPQSGNDVLTIVAGSGGGGGGGGGGGDDESSCTTQPGMSWFWLALVALSVAAVGWRQAGLRRT
jgi:hypothetical protein